MSFYLFLLQVVAGVVAFGFAAVVLALAVSMVRAIIKGVPPKQDTPAK